MRVSRETPVASKLLGVGDSGWGRVTVATEVTGRFYGKQRSRALRCIANATAERGRFGVFAKRRPRCRRESEAAQDPRETVEHSTSSARIAYAARSGGRWTVAISTPPPDAMADQVHVKPGGEGIVPVPSSLVAAPLPAPH